MVEHNVATDREAGFTLVELAVVMIIIGLLIGGVLKGQELIANAQITSTVAQVKGIDAATTTFRDMYDSMPGDMPNPTTRLPACTAAPCNIAGNGNRRVDGDFSNAPATEERGFWSHLNAADLMTGLDPAQGAVWGGESPEAEIGGGFHAAFHGGGGGATMPNLQGVTASDVRAGHYLALHVNPNGGVNATGFLTPNQAFRIDQKLDDGVPGTGSVMAAGAGTCINGTAYNESVPSAACNLYIRFQN